MVETHLKEIRVVHPGPHCQSCLLLLIARCTTPNAPAMPVITEYCKGPHLIQPPHQGADRCAPASPPHPICSSPPATPISHGPYLSFPYTQQLALEIKCLPCRNVHQHPPNLTSNSKGVALGCWAFTLALNPQYQQCLNPQHHLLLSILLIRRLRPEKDN